MQSTSKQAFVANISKALGRDRLPEKVEAPDLSKGPQATMYQDLSQDEVIEMFKKECDALSIRYTEATMDNIADVVMDAIKEWGGGKLIYPQVEQLEAYGLDKAFADNDGKDGLSFVAWDPEKSREENVHNAQDANLGLTFPIMGIAETATLLQPSNKESGRSIGLLPLTHIAVLKRSTIVPRMTQVMKHLTELYREDAKAFPSSVIHISGPSSTVDIELVRVVGVHGPINLTYIILND